MHVHSKMAKRKAGSVFTITIKHGENKKQKKHIFHCKYIDISASKEVEQNLTKKRKSENKTKKYFIFYLLSSIFYYSSLIKQEISAIFAYHFSV